MKKKRMYNCKFQENKLFVPLNIVFGIVLIITVVFIGDYIFTDKRFSFNIQTKLKWRELSPE